MSTTSPPTPFGRTYAGLFLVCLATLTYVLIAVPFVFSGIVVSVALTRFPAQVGRLYGADLIGASSACVLFVYVLKIVDAPTVVILIAAAAGVAALCFAPARTRLTL